MTPHGCMALRPAHTQSSFAADEQGEITRLRQELVQYPRAFGERERASSNSYSQSHGMGHGTHTCATNSCSYSSSAPSMVTDKDVTMDDGMSSSGKRHSQNGFPDEHDTTVDKLIRLERIHIHHIAGQLCRTTCRWHENKDTLRWRPPGHLCFRTPLDLLRGEGDCEIRQRKLCRYVIP